MRDFYASFAALRSWCEAERFKGWDPYDGLNSKIFQALPFFRKSALCRLIMIQGFKRCPVNLRRIALVPKEYNAKGIGLFLQGYCNLYKAVSARPELEEKLGSKEEILSRVHELTRLLISLQSKGYSGACWGYNFDWQARRLFLFPKFTPTVVATSFCATALMEAYEVTGDRHYLDTALSSAEFIIKDLHRTPCSGGFLFSYSPLKGNDTVYNASLLGSRLLSYCYCYTHKEEYKKIAKDNNIEDHVIFTGKLSGKKLQDEYEDATVGVGSLGLYNNGMFIGSTLKTREYLLRGIPFVYGCEELGISKDYPYALLVPNDSSTISINSILNFSYPLIEDSEKISMAMNTYAKEEFSWKKILCEVFNINSNG